jgi:DNA-binding IclR family transcriptional regulator
MATKKPKNSQERYNIMVLNVLKELSKTPNARLSVREISRVLEINPMAVSRSIKHLNYLLDIKEGSDFESFRLNLYLVRLKDEFIDMGVDEMAKKMAMAKRLDQEIFKR